MRNPFRTVSYPFSVRSDRAAREVAAALGHAVRERRYIDGGRLARPFYRIEGEVSLTSVRLRVSPYVIPGVAAGRGSVPLIVQGEIRTVDLGSELTGTISAPVTRFEWFLFALVSAVWFLMAVPSGNLLLWLGLELVAVLFLAVLSSTIRLGYVETYRPHVAQVLIEAINENRNPQPTPA